jgi:hypothetical protein
MQLNHRGHANVQQLIYTLELVSMQLSTRVKQQIYRLQIDLENVGLTNLLCARYNLAYM